MKYLLDDISPKRERVTRLTYRDDWRCTHRYRGYRKFNSQGIAAVEQNVGRSLDVVRAELFGKLQSRHRKESNREAKFWINNGLSRALVNYGRGCTPLDGRGQVHRPTGAGQARAGSWRVHARC